MAGAVFSTLLQLPGYLMRKKALDIRPEPGIRIISCNVRYLNFEDQGNRSWFCRADKLLGAVAREAPGIIGFQEVTRWQYRYLVDTLPGYDSVITYRDDTRWAEGCPVFYHKSLYTLVDKGSFWLSETPEVMSRDWGAGCYRVCSYVILREKASGKDFVVFNTHLDHASDEARIGGIRVVMDKITRFGGLPSVIMGDFNAEEGSATYENVTGHFHDARYAAENTDPTGTFHGWGQLESVRIDYFMLSKTGFRIHRYGVVDVARNGVYASDHSPIRLDVTLTETIP